MEAFLLLKMSADKDVYGSARSIIEQVKTLNGVVSADLLFGDYDAIVQVDLPKIHDIENLVIEELSMINGITSSVTLLGVDNKIFE